MNTAEMFFNYKNWEATISTPTTYAISTGLGRVANFVRIISTVEINCSINGGDSITMAADTEYKFADMFITTVLLTPSGSSAIKIYAS